MHHRSVPLLLATAFGSAALALGPPASADPLSDRLIQKARQLPAQTLAANLVTTFQLGERKEEITGKARLKRPNLGRIELNGPVGQPLQAMVSDGKALFVLLTAAQQYVKLEGGAGLGAQLGRISPPAQAFLDPAAYFSRWSETRRAPASTINGRKYEVVRFQTGQPAQPGTAYFEPGGLLAGVELVLNEGGEKGTLKAWLRSIKLDAPLKAADLAFKPPPGYTQFEQPDHNKNLLPVGKTAPDFLLPQPGGLGNLALSTAGKDKKAVLINFWFYG